MGGKEVSDPWAAALGSRARRPRDESFWYARSVSFWVVLDASKLVVWVGLATTPVGAGLFVFDAGLWARDVETDGVELELVEPWVLGQGESGFEAVFKVKLPVNFESKHALNQFPVLNSNDRAGAEGFGVPASPLASFFVSALIVLVSTVEPGRDSNACGLAEDPPCEDGDDWAGAELVGVGDGAGADEAGGAPGTPGAALGGQAESFCQVLNRVDDVDRAPNAADNTAKGRGLAATVDLGLEVDAEPADEPCVEGATLDDAVVALEVSSYAPGFDDEGAVIIDRVVPAGADLEGEDAIEE